MIFTARFHSILALATICWSVLLIGIAGCTVNKSPSLSTESSVYDRVVRSGKIRCGYGIYNPGCMKDPNTGKLSGVGVDTMELVAKNLDLEVVWVEEVGWGSMIEGLETNRYDVIVTPVWATSNRAQVADFSRPLYFSPVCAYTKAGNKAFSHGLQNLNSSRYSIATIDGATAEVIAQEDFPKVRRVSLPQMSEFGQLLLTVSSGKADVTFTEPADAAIFMKHNPGTVQQAGPPVRVFPNCWMIRRGQYEFKSMIDTSLSQLLNSGAVDKIIRKYEPQPNLLYRVGSPYRQIGTLH